ncbi:3,4-dioxygenase subunit beta [Nocardioides sp. R-C-SC26]|uniref:dioxygenase family protein n=1 Tax=Nocardioides sp. R-C-SC26 TaxID=2870414 RepID=UPI001E568814|nr:3,4-dioxygenase subunit beta [Nocardioides sp. R-C-SC26]
MSSERIHDHDDHREGLSFDLPAMQDKGMVRRTWGRRGVFGLMGGLGAAALVACRADDTTSAVSDTGPGGTPPAGGPGGGGGGGMSPSQDGLDEGDIPEETNGPYPADGTNGVNVLTESGIVRSDIRSSFGDSSGVAAGVPVTIALKIFDNNADGITPYPGAAVYLWQCDRDGLYSLYSAGAEDENYLRGVQEAADDGSLTFTSIFPACYEGRWPHLHFEVYGSLDDATSASNKLRTSQIAFPADICSTVYDTAEGYESSQTTFSRVSLDTDGIFSDGYSLQMGNLTGSVEEGYTLTLNVPV